MAQFSTKRILLFQIFLHLTLSVVLADTGKHDAYEELTTIKISHTQRSRRSTGDRLRYVDVSFPLKGSDVVLNLEKNIRMTDIRLSELHAGYITELYDGINKEDKICAYQDEKNGAAITIHYGDGYSDEEPKTSGMFIFDGQQYTLEPLGSDMTETSIFSHRIRERGIPAGHRGAYISLDDSVRMEPLANDVHHRMKRATEPPYTIELLSVLDYTIFEYWNNTSTAKTKEAVWEETKTSIYYYYVTVINGIDIRYRNMQSFPIAIKPVEIIITTDPLDSNWTLDNKDTGEPRDTLLSSVALDAFRTWVSKSNLSPHDHAMLFTRFDLKMSNTINAGLAYMGKVCTESAQSIVEENFSFSVSTTAAHELAHNLGVKHDGDTNTCSAQDYYIMAPVSGPQTGAKALNPWIFSSCSVVYFRQMIQELDALGNNCLVVKNNVSPVNITKYMSPLFGQIIKADEQCQHAVSKDSYFCAGQYTNGDYSTICTIMWCKEADPSVSCTSVTAADGTLCGDHKVCIAGVCTDYPEAPKVGCYGNQYIEFCSRLNRWDCYTPTYLGYCCKTCENFMSPSFPPGCSYGDKQSGCNFFSCSTYSNTELQKCCGTCSHLFPNDTTTANPFLTTTKSAFLDGHDQCRNEVASDSRICGAQYNGNFGTICTTLWCKQAGATNACSGIKAVESTLCGDNKICVSGVCTYSSEVPAIGCFADLYMTYCMGLRRWQCYTKTDYDYCCRTCDAYKHTSFPSGCLFGDKVSGCSYDSCSSYTTDKLNKCCGTCSHMFATTTTVPTTTTTSTTTTPKTTTTPTTTTTTTTPTTTTTTTTTGTTTSTTTTTPTTTTTITTTPTTTSTTTTPTTTTKMPTTTTTSTTSTTTTTTPTTTSTTTTTTSPTTTTTTTPITTTTPTPTTTTTTTPPITTTTTSTTTTTKTRTPTTISTLTTPTTTTKIPTTKPTTATKTPTTTSTTITRTITKTPATSTATKTTPTTTSSTTTPTTTTKKPTTTSTTTSTTTMTTTAKTPLISTRRTTKPTTTTKMPTTATSSSTTITTTLAEDKPEVDGLTGSDIIAITVGVLAVIIVVICLILCIAIVRYGLCGRLPKSTAHPKNGTEKSLSDSPTGSSNVPAVWFTKGKRFNTDAATALDMYYHSPYSFKGRGTFHGSRKSHFSL